MLRAGVTGLDGRQRGPHPSDAEHLFAPQPRPLGDVLRKIAQRPRPRDRSPRRLS